MIGTLPASSVSRAFHDSEFAAHAARGYPLCLADAERRPLGKTREIFSDTIHPLYVQAFEAIDGDANSELLIAERDGAVVGRLQLTLIPGISRHGALRAQIESVRIAGPLRGKGIGTAMIDAALARAKSRGAVFAQLTSDVRRTDARRFYERLGFSGSHIGFKRDL